MAKQNSPSGMTYQTKGDANEIADSDFVAENNVIGKVVFQVPYVGQLIRFLRTPSGFLALIVLPSLLFIGLELWNIKKEIEKDVEKKVLARVQKENPSN